MLHQSQAWWMVRMVCGLQRTSLFLPNKDEKVEESKKKKMMED